jgi:hypothetical protein
VSGDPSQHVVEGVSRLIDASADHGVSVVKISDASIGFSKTFTPFGL